MIFVCQREVMQYQASSVQDGFARTEIFHNMYNKACNISNQFVNNLLFGCFVQFSKLLWFRRRSVGIFTSIVSVVIVAAITVQLMNRRNDQINQREECPELQFGAEGMTIHCICNSLDPSKLDQYCFLVRDKSNIHQRPAAHGQKSGIVLKSSHGIQHDCDSTLSMPLVNSSENSVSCHRRTKHHTFSSTMRTGQENNCVESSYVKLWAFRKHDHCT
mmetsp:Transcript_904/g.2091  ORF Transcript_904/g.2091 Transcript_904/m.2091 type:complete len:217 (+) Transcript_904:370-1020(+)